MQHEELYEVSDYFIETQSRPASFYMPYEHSHSVLEFYYLRRGSCLYMVNGSFVPLEAGSIIIIPPSVKHNTSYTGSTPSERVAVYIRQEALPSFIFDKAPRLSVMLSSTSRLMLDSEGKRLICMLLSKMQAAQNNSSRSIELLMPIYICELLMLTYIHSMPADDVFIPLRAMDADIEKAIHIMNSGFSEQLSLKQIADSLKLNPSYLSHKFSVLTGHRIKKYLNSIRLRHAAHQLIVSDDSITKIASDCGFSSSNYFKDVFKKDMGCSPREYRGLHSVSRKFGSGIAG